MKYLFILVFISVGFFFEVFAQSAIQYSHYFRNNFPGGQVIIDGTTYTVSTVPSYKNRPIGVFKGWTGIFDYDNIPHVISAIDNQNIDNYNRVFKNWTRNGSSLTNDIQFSTYPVANLNGTEFEAVFHKICNINFVTNPNSAITVNNVSYGAVTPTFAWQNLVSISALSSNYSENYVNFVFQGWEDNNGNLVDPVFYTNANATYTAVFKGYPLNTNRNLTSPGPIGQAVSLTWNEHPSTGVTQYQIWRRIATGSGGNYGPEELIATLNRGTCTYTDQQWCKSDKYYDAILQYDVRAYYAPDQTTSSVWYKTVWGGYWDLEKTISNLNSQIVLENALFDNYPNPFNPETQIRFSIKEDSHVSLKIYDILGNEVKTLVNEFIPAGSHSYSFDGSNLSSGLYIYSLKSNNFSVTKKMMLTK